MTADPETHAETIQSAQKMMQAGEFVVARKNLDHVLQDDPDHIDALYMTAVCWRYEKDYQRALKILRKLQKSSPEFGRAYQEEGHTHKAMGHPDKALMAYHRASQFNPGLDATWRAMAQLFAHFGDEERQKDAEQKLVRLQKLPQELRAATNLLYEGKIARAEDFCRHFLRKNPKNTEGMRLLAQIGERLGAMDEVEFLLDSAVEFEPDNLPLRLDYVEILRKRQKFDKALEQAEWLHTQDPDNPMYKAQLAIQKMQSGEYEASINLYDEVIKLRPNDPAAWSSKGHAQKTFGLQDEAVTSYRKSFEARPDYGEGYFSLSNLKTYRFEDHEISDMRAQLRNESLSFKDRILFCFALGKAYEDLKDYKTSFQYYKEANELGSVQMRYKSEQMTKELQAQKEACTVELFNRKSQAGYPAKDPIFIVGLPRAGSTLLEQIIASHSQVDGTHELANILSLAHKLRGRGRGTEESKYPRGLSELPAEMLYKLGERFIDETRIHRKEAPFFIDKMPNNFRHIGLIHLILPNAKIIDARRHPMACCFSGFKQHFAEGQEFTYGLENVGTYYRDYVDLMDHWDEVLPEKILRVQYEDVVADTETQVRRILEYLGLPFEEACLEFHKTKRSVRTASSEQVRQPIYKSGLEQWRHYEPWLDPLKEALGPVLKRYPIM